MTNKFHTVSLPALVGKLNADNDRIKVYTVEAPASLVANFYALPALQVEGGFQRPLDPTRAEKIGRINGGDRDRELLPSPNLQGGLLAFGNEEDVQYVQSSSQLRIKKPLPLIDGQHRSAGDAWAVEHGMVTDYTETVKIVVGATHDELVTWYLRSNMEAKHVPAANVLVNAATMEGVVLSRKTWVARNVVKVATDEPFITESGLRIVRFEPRDSGRFTAFTLYKATNIMLPDRLNAEGAEIESEALDYTHKAWKLYADLFAPNWGLEHEGVISQHDAYTSTMLLAYARLYHAAEVQNVRDIEAIVRKAWKKTGLARGLPTHSTSSGDAAAVSLAGFLAAEAGLKPMSIAA